MAMEGIDFALRYGGSRDIQWFKGKDINQLRQLFAGGLPPVHPVSIAVEAAKIAAIYMQWWEMRKQHYLNAVQPEERRLTWVVDIMTQWFTELDQGTIKIDTISYFDRELSRLFSRIEENDLLDVPSSLLLQLNRTADFLVLMNRNIHMLILESGAQNQMPPAIPQSVTYTPYYVIQKEPEKYLTHFNTSPSGGINEGEYRKKLKSLERRAEFNALEALSIELKSAHALLSILAGYPPTVKYYSNEEIEHNLPGHRLLSDGAS